MLSKRAAFSLAWLGVIVPGWAKSVADGAELRDAKPSVTYCKDIAPILQKHCVECHRPGQVAPFSLETYAQARKRAEDIAGVVADRIMPPWKAVAHVGVKLAGDKSLTEQEIATIASWSDAGAPEGNRADLPPPRQFRDDWLLGTPDLIVDTSADFAIPAAGDDIYRCFVVPTDLPRDMYVSGVEYRPGNRRVVHHILAYVDTTGVGRKNDAADATPGYPCFAGPGIEAHNDLGGWVPGLQPNLLPDGIGRSLPRKSDIIVQVHYHPSGRPESDRTRIGLYFARKPVSRTLHRGAAWNPDLVLSPGAPDPTHIEVKASWKIPVDVIAFGAAPHMHLLGRDMLMSVRYPDGRTQDLLKVDDWNFNWQFGYRFAQPLLLPRGTVLEVVAHYDNSAGNPFNPNKPPKVVKWGEATTDEMCIGFIMLLKKDQDLTRPGEQDDLRQLIVESGGNPILSERAR